MLPVLGAGASYDCGVRLARDLANDLHGDYMADPTYDPRPSNANALADDLGAVADAIGLVRSQKEVVEALGIHDPGLWPPAQQLRDHFCAYRILARLAREDLFAEAITFNYDSAFEAALQDEGFLFSPTTLRGRQWNDHATVVADAAMNATLQRRGAFVLNKVHGSAQRYREAVRSGLSNPEDAMIIRWSQLLDWRRDQWARDILSDRARRHVLLLLGFSGQDPVIHIALTRILEDVYAQGPRGDARVIVIGHHPDTLTLRMLVRSGTGATASPGRITHVSTEPASTTAITLVLLTELLAVRLERASRGFRAPVDLEARLTSLTLAGPTMLRWSFLLRRPTPWTDYAQRINLEQAAERGYVPLMADPRATVAALTTRARIRSLLGHRAPETSREALAANGFIVAPAKGRAYLPVGLPHSDLLHASRNGGELEQARRLLPYPGALDSVLVGEGTASPRGVSINTGAEVPVP